MHQVSQSSPHLESKSFLTVTDRALARIKELLAAKPDARAIRVSVKTGGCSGLSYSITYASSVDAFDEVMEIEEVKILVDKRAILYIMGSQLDYVEQQFSSGFIFLNSNEKSRCGCGKSFSF